MAGLQYSRGWHYHRKKRVTKRRRQTGPKPHGTAAGTQRNTQGKTKGARKRGPQKEADERQRKGHERHNHTNKGKAKANVRKRRPARSTHGTTRAPKPDMGPRQSHPQPPKRGGTRGSTPAATSDPPSTQGQERGPQQPRVHTPGSNRTTATCTAPHDPPQPPCYPPKPSNAAHHRAVTLTCSTCREPRHPGRASGPPHDRLTAGLPETRHPAHGKEPPPNAATRPPPTEL